MTTDELTKNEEKIIRKVVWQLEWGVTGKCLECNRGRLSHLIRPLICPAVVGMLRARLGM